MPQVIVEGLRQTPCLPCLQRTPKPVRCCSTRAPSVVPRLRLLRMSSFVSSLTGWARCVHAANMSLLGALLLALVGTAIATPAVLEENTITSLASKAAVQVKSANSLQSTFTPGVLSSGQVLPQVRPSCTLDPYIPAAWIGCPNRLGPLDSVPTEACGSAFSVVGLAAIAVAC